MHPWLRKLAGASLVVVLVFTAIAGRAQDDKGSGAVNQKASYAYVLTMEKINKLADVRATLGEFLAHNEQASKSIDDDKTLAEGSFAQRARALDIKHPEVAAIIRKKGISTLEYALASQVLLKAFLLVGAKKEGEIQDYSKAGAGINPANLTFIEQHWEEIRKTIQVSTRLRM